MKSISIISILLLVGSNGFGQFAHNWFGDKPNTKMDSSMIEKMKIDKIFTLEQLANDAELTSKKYIDTVELKNNMSSISCQLISSNTNGVKIVQLYAFDRGANWINPKTRKGKFRLNHYLDSEGFVVKTIKEWIYGSTVKDWEEIRYTYEGNLLMTASYYIISSRPRDAPWIVLTYEYHQEKN
jgi:hypothetical protein